MTTPLPTVRTRSPRSGVLGRIALRCLLYLLLLLIAAIIAVPVLWGISSSFKDQAGVYATPPAWIPSPAVTDNYVEAWTTLPFGNFFINSLKVAGLITI